MAAINDVIDLSAQGDIAIVTVNSPPVNALSAKVREGLHKAFTGAIADRAVAAIVLVCDGRTFIAGADISELGKPSIAPSIREIQDLVENAPKPVITAIHGTALGGGLEIALATHYRVATSTAKAGLPEVNIGLLPGAGGTQRLPRIVGVETALDLLTSGRHVPAPEALRMGLFDHLVETDLREGAIAFAHLVVAEGKPLRRIRDSNEKLDAARGHPEVFTKFRKANAKRFRGFDAPEANMQAIEAAVNEPFAAAMEIERELFRTLMARTQSGAQRHVFFAERQVSKIPDVADDTPTRPIQKIGIVGAGTMGGGIAMNFLNVGLPVTILETEQAALNDGVATIRRNYERSLSTGKLKQSDLDARMELLTSSLQMQDLADCDLVIEAVFELMDVKKTVFTQLDRIAKPNAILASNTSYLNIDEIAAVTSRPQDVLGLHFFSPANVMALLEVVRGRATAKDVIATAMKLGKQINKVAVLAGNCHGFIGNRMLAQRQREVLKLWLEGAKLWDIDRVIYDFGMPMGPFAMNDLAGLDLGLDPHNKTPTSVREALVHMGRRGQKTSAGYYDYDEHGNRANSDLVEQVVRDFASKQGIVQREISDQEILERCLYPMVNEGAKILSEGVALRASDIDVVWVKGYGWPAYRGGPMYWADLVGLGEILGRLRELQREAFEPAPLLEGLVAEGRGFKTI
jgi:3-hydroxyacyl-CoA dehydrogenase